MLLYKKVVAHDFRYDPRTNDFVYEDYYLVGDDFVFFVRWVATFCSFHIQCGL